MVSPCVQVRNRKARQASSSLKQPMLQSAYSEPPLWTLTRLIRTAIITLVSGAIAGVALLPQFIENRDDAAKCGACLMTDRHLRSCVRVLQSWHALLLIAAA